MHVDLSIHVGLLVGLPELLQTGAAASHEIARTDTFFPGPIPIEKSWWSSHLPDEVAFHREL